MGLSHTAGTKYEKRVECLEFGVVGNRLAYWLCYLVAFAYTVVLESVLRIELRIDLFDVFVLKRIGGCAGSGFHSRAGLCAIHADLWCGIVCHNREVVDKAYPFTEHSVKRALEHSDITVLKLLHEKFRRTRNGEHVVLQAFERQRAKPIVIVFLGNCVADYLQALIP